MAGRDIKTVATRMRHASPVVTLRVYAHMFPDSDDATRAAIGGAIAARVAGGSRIGAAISRPAG